MVLSVTHAVQQMADIITLVYWPTLFTVTARVCLCNYKLMTTAVCCGC